jgi:Ti-type conjugative transfer relaxase TraA
MAIGFVRSRYISRSIGGNACRSSAYNARSIIVDEKTGEIFDFTKKKDLAYHEIMLPEYVNKRFQNPSVLSNEVEANERRCDSQLYIEWVLALPKEEEVTLEMKVELVKRFIKYKGWVDEGLGVQVDIHAPHDDRSNRNDGKKNSAEKDIEQKELNNNWHPHILVTPRRFRKDGEGFERLKARDLQPKVINGRVIEETKDSIAWTNIQNEFFKEHGLDLRVDVPGVITQEHIGPVRMRSVMNAAVVRNEERRIAEIEHLNNGQALLDKVTLHMSVFTKSDLMRAVKCVPDQSFQERLVEEALEAKSVINLFDLEDNKTNLYTTKSVRAEEEKIMRLAGYVVAEENVVSFGGSKAVNRVNRLIAQEKAANSRLSGEQERALTELLLGDCGVRILKGRAGSGKSYVLGKVCSIAESTGVNVIGLAPTHKARIELVKVGYEQNDTVKGILFKLANGRFSLPKHSLILVDEAGMVGNDDYQELLRVSATRKCNVILSGDERQLSSVGRGGMFEVISEKHGSSTIFDIKRQSSNWGREVASCFADSRVLEGLNILERNERIKWSGNADKSMQELLGDWGSSKYDIGDRLILAVENRHVNALNAGARQYLKAAGRLEGEEISVSANYYMKGDRILITGTNKELGVINGDLGEILHASMDKFVIGIAGKEKEIEFNPKEYDGFKHGYATTVFKAQGASIKDVYVFHDRFSGIRNGYVSLTRHIDELRLYTNRESTVDMKMLVKQLGREFGKGSSLHYLTEEDIRYRNNIGEAKNTIKGIFMLGVLNVLERVADKYIPKSEYYNYKEPDKAVATVEKVIDNFALEEEAAGFGLENKIAVGEASGNRISNSLAVSTATPKPRTVTKDSFYANNDYVRGQKSRVDLKTQWDKEAEELKAHLKFKSEIVARDLLGEPNKRLSNGRELRYGEHGKIVVRISGDKAGMWHDFSESKGGDLFSLVQHVRGGEFKDAAEYLRGVVGMESTTSLRLVHDHSNSNKYVDRHKSKRLEERIEKQKIKVTSNLLSRAKEINHKSIAYRYLREKRNITCALSKDIKTTGIYEREAGKSFPALIAFARDEKGNVTGGQRLLLDNKTYGKEKVDIPKKSFGHISGSFVEVSNPSLNLENLGERLLKSYETITIIAEGLETALSIKQALGEHSEKKGNTEAVRILCSLGISNIKNYRAREGEKIIIAADNDGSDSITGKTVMNAKVLLEEKRAFVEAVKPDRKGDFNDLLKAGESKLINSLFAPAIAVHSAKTLPEYVKAREETKPVTLDENDKANLAYIESRGINQEEIINAWRKSKLQGKIELDDMRKKVSIAEHNLAANSSILEIAEKYKVEISKGALFEDLVHNFSRSAEEVCINRALEQFTKEKWEAGKIGDVYNIIKREDGFLSELKLGDKEYLSNNLRERIDLSQNGESKKVLGSLKENLEANYKQGIIPYGELKNMLISFGPDIKGMDIHLNKLAIEGREKHLRYVSLEMNELDKLGSKYDKDSWVRDLKDAKNYKEMKAYAQNILGLEAKKHLEPKFLQLENERLNAGNFWQFLNVVAKEQQIHLDIREKHRFAIRAIDRVNGNLKYTVATTHASDIKSAVTTQKAIGLIGYAAKNNIVSEQKIRDDINNRGGDIRNIYSVVKFKCDAINEQKMENQKLRQQEIAKQNQQQKDMSRGRGGMSL